MKLLPALPVLALAIGAMALVSADKESAVPHLASEKFAETVGDGKVHFIKWYAPWCGHCRRLAPVWGELYEAYKGSDRIAISSVDCTQEKDLCAAHGVRGYPTLKVFQGGEEKEQFKGPRTLEQLKEFVEQQATTLLDETTA